MIAVSSMVAQPSVGCCTGSLAACKLCLQILKGAGRLKLTANLNEQINVWSNM